MRNLDEDYFFKKNIRIIDPTLYVRVNYEAQLTANAEIKLPDNDFDDFDVSFYPEGGSSLHGAAGRIAFKAVRSDGVYINVEGTVYDSVGNEVGHFNTDSRGMGSFLLKPEPDETYYAVCTTDKGQTKRVELPAAKADGYALSCIWSRERLIVSVNKPESQQSGDSMILIVQTRGVIQDIIIWENTKEPIIFSKDFFPSGVSHLLLLNKNVAPVSERLIFVDNTDHAKVESYTDKEVYAARSPVEITVNITNDADEAVFGNFSVSVTDDNIVVVDSTINIMTSLLLTSDLRGNISAPAYFFRKDRRSSEYALDLLMLTQGWRRYDVERIINNDLIYPDTLSIMGYELSGTVRTQQLGRRPVEDAHVSVLSLQNGFSDETVTDDNGRFNLRIGEAPDGAWFVVQTTERLGLRHLELILDETTYPERKIPVIASSAIDRAMLSMYADKAEQQYVEEHGERASNIIPELTITAERRVVENFSFFYDVRNASFTITEDDIEKFPPASMNFLLRRIPHLTIDPYLRRGRDEVILIVDDMSPEMSAARFYDLHPSDIVQIDLVYGPGYMFNYGSTPWLLSITTRIKKTTPKDTPYVKYYMPLGFQKPVEFYAPKYETPAQNTIPDLRTTIHWQPNITTNENGTATFSFYTADTPAKYAVVIEGLTEEGKIIYHNVKIIVKDD